MLGKKITIDYEINNIFYKTIYNTVDNYIDIIKEGEQDFNIRFDPDKIDDVLCMIKKHRKDSKFSYTIPQEDMIYKNYQYTFQK